MIRDNSIWVYVFWTFLPIFSPSEQPGKPWKSLSCVQLFVTPWTVARQASLYMRFPRQEYWDGLPVPSRGNLPNPGFEPGSPALQADSLHLSHQESPVFSKNVYCLNFLKISKNFLKFFYCLHGFTFSRLSYSSNHILCGLFWLALIALKFPCVISWLDSSFFSFIYLYFYC